MEQQKSQQMFHEKVEIKSPVKTNWKYLTIVIVAVSAILAVSRPVSANGIPVQPVWFELIRVTLQWLFIVLLLLATAMGIISGLWMWKKKDPSIPKFLRFTVYVFTGFGIVSIFLFLMTILQDIYF